MKNIGKINYIDILLILLLVSSSNSAISSSADTRIPVEVTSSCKEEVGAEIYKRIQAAVTKGVAIYNNGVTKIHIRQASKTEDRIIIDFSSKEKKTLFLDVSDVTVTWYIQYKNGTSRVLHKAQYEQKDNVVSYRIASNDIIRATNKVLTVNGILPKGPND